MEDTVEFMTLDGEMSIIQIKEHIGEFSISLQSRVRLQHIIPFDIGK
jgi:hypothetical protein